MSQPILTAAQPARFSALAIGLHWLIAGLVIWNLYLGVRHDYVDEAASAAMMQLHKSLGVTILGLSIVRLAWRLRHPPPPLPATLAPWERSFARLTHWSFYGLTIGLPLVGWVIVSASVRNIPTLLYNTILWPRLPILPDLPDASRKAVTSAAADTHVTLAWIAIALVVLHIGAALKHQFLDRDGVLYRMAPLRFLRPRS